MAEPELTTRCHVVRGGSIEPSGDGLRFEHGPRAMGTGALEARARRALLQLGGAGIDEDDLAAAIVAEGIESRLQIGVMLQQLKLSGLLEETLVAGGIEHATRRVVSQSFRPTPFEADQRYVLSRFAYVRRDAGGLVLESPRSHWRVQMHTGAAADWLRVLSETAGVSGEPWLSFLAEAGMLTGVDADGLSDEDRDDHLRSWEFHDLLFHDRSRRGRHDGVVGGTFRFRGVTPPTPLRRAPAAGEVAIDLPVPDESEEVGESMAAPTFAAVLGGRRSERPLDAAISLEQLAELLFRSARAQRHDEDRGLSWRPYPTGGAVGELDVYICVARSPDLEPGLYRYDSLDHRLFRLPTSPDRVAALLESAASAQGRDQRPAALLSLASRFGRVAWKYEGLAYALMLKNSGALIQTIYLVATSMRLAACGVGTGSNADFARATGLPEHVEGPVAEITLG